MENYEKLFLKDTKEYVKYIIDYYNNSNGDSFDLLMRFFATDDKRFGGYTYDKKFISFNDLEKREFAQYVYELLGWNDNKYFDVMNSFWTVYCSALDNIAKTKKLTYEKVFSKACSEFLYDFQQEGIYYCYWKNDENNWKKIILKKKKYAEKIINDIEIHRNAQKALIDIYSKFIDFSSLCHCVANFMPCPDAYEKGKLSYNQIKGVLPDVQDYFPLMIDKIEKCYVEKTGIKYHVDNKQELISYDTVEKWHKWFVENREEYCLEGYYEYKDGKLKGIELFNGQTLEHPVPLEKNEIEECLEEMIKRIKTRAMRMARKLEQQ